jgi:hypothetical protein
MRTEFLNKLFKYVVNTSKKYNIDESHAVKHSMDVFFYANKIYYNELKRYPILKEQKTIIDISSILHDMCDKKYMDEEEGIKNIEEYIREDVNDNDLSVVKKIIKTMSYSKVMKYGYPDMGKYEMSYHIVREADLLAAYDFERCIIYQMVWKNHSYEESILDAINVFDNRVLKYDINDLFLTNFSKKECIKLKKEAMIKIDLYKKIHNFL